MCIKKVILIGTFQGGSKGVNKIMSIKINILNKH